MLAWALNWIYFDVGNRRTQHALTRKFYYSTSLFEVILLIIAIGYNFAMNFIVTGLTLTGAILLVVASDSRDSNIDEFTDEFAAVSLYTILQSLRWCFACGLATGTLAMGISPHT